VHREPIEAARCCGIGAQADMVWSCRGGASVEASVVECSGEQAWRHNMDSRWRMGRMAWRHGDIARMGQCTGHGIAWHGGRGVVHGLTARRAHGAWTAALNLRAFFIFLACA
jgi:hypothetical protein